jgi:hypothetical protein
VKTAHFTLFAPERLCQQRTEGGSVGCTAAERVSNIIKEIWLAVLIVGDHQGTGFDGPQGLQSHRDKN